MIGVALVSVAHAGAKRMVSLPSRMGSRLGLRFKRTANGLSTGKLHHVIFYCGSLGASFRSGFDINVSHS
jgi:hypothetical protein